MAVDRDANAQLARGVVLAALLSAALAIVVPVGGLGNWLSDTALMAVAVIAFQVSITDLILGGLGVLRARRREQFPLLPTARVVGRASPS